MNLEVQLAVLKLLSRKDVRWNWYRLERALSQQRLGGQENLMALLAEFESKGLVNVIPTENPAMPVYELTEKGRSSLLN